MGSGDIVDQGVKARLGQPAAAARTLDAAGTATIAAAPAEAVEAAVCAAAGNAAAAPRQRLVRMTWMSRSRIFLRSVLRLRPNSSAALIWLPRVAASAADSSGYSTSFRMR